MNGCAPGLAQIERLKVTRNGMGSRLVNVCPQMNPSTVYKCTNSGYKLHCVELEIFIRLFLSVVVNDFYSCSFIFIDGWTLSIKGLCLLLFHCFVFQCLQSSGTCEPQAPAV